MSPQPTAAQPVQQVTQVGLIRGEDNIFFTLKNVKKMEKTAIHVGFRSPPNEGPVRKPEICFTRREFFWRTRYAADWCNQNCSSMSASNYFH
jgi:hypothetical protein